MDRLANKVAALNRLNGIANEFVVNMREAMNPWAGKPVLKSDGDINKRFRESIGHLLVNTHELRIFRRHWDHHRIAFDITINWRVGEHVVDFYTVSVGLATVSGGILDAFHVSPNRPTNYNVEAIRALQAQIKQASAILQKWEMALLPFRESD